MSPAQTSRVFIVDDDASVRDALSWLLRTRRLVSEMFDSADAFLSEIGRWAGEPDEPSCLLLDVRMPGMSGLALFEHLLTLPWHPVMPVIFLSGHADVSTAVDAVKRGAFDFCEKPFSDNALVDRVEQALRLSDAMLQQRRAQRDLLEYVVTAAMVRDGKSGEAREFISQRRPQNGKGRGFPISGL
ncbi:MAG: response regulator transcription factor [Reyranella sp.]|nr:response regulator transcription factor [Reyranella sp.]